MEQTLIELLGEQNAKYLVTLLQLHQKLKSDGLKRKYC